MRLVGLGSRRGRKSLQRQGRGQAGLVGRRPTQQGTGRVSTPVQVCIVNTAQMNDTVSVAAQPLEIAGDRAFVFGERKDQAIREFGGKLCQLPGTRHGARLLR